MDTFTFYVKETTKHCSIYRYLTIQCGTAENAPKERTLEQIYLCLSLFV